MGSPQTEPGHRPDERQHPVTIAKPFEISATEITQRQWTAIMGRNPSHFRDDPDAPVEQVTWYDAQEFIRRLNARGHGHYRLPTEAEWEYACRAGTTTAYNTGRYLSSSLANYDARYPLKNEPPGIYRGRTMRVKSFPPNAWGVYDMHGNVWEWCDSEYGDSGLKVIRGGSWYFDADSARSALRYTHAPYLKGFSIGFRVVRQR